MSQHYLDTFRYEIFLSYGWAGANERQGARLWVRTLRDELERRIAIKLHTPRIYFDEDDIHFEPVPSKLRTEVQSSAILIFIESPGSCRPASWCQEEIVHFWDSARPLASPQDKVAPEDRMLRVLLSSAETVPYPISTLSPLVLSAAKTPESLAAPEFGGLLDSLAEQTSERLKRIKRLESSGRRPTRIFLGAAAVDRERFAKLRLELLNGGFEVVSASTLPIEREPNEHQYAQRVESAHQDCRLAIHLLPTESIDRQPCWQLNPSAIQIAHSLHKSQANQNFSAFIWKSPGVSVFDADSSQAIERIGYVKGDQLPSAMVFEDIWPNLRSSLVRPTQLPDGDGDIDIVIDYWDDDVDEAERIRAYLSTRHNRRATKAYAYSKDEKPDRITKRNQKNFYPRAKRFLVLFGRTSQTWPNDVSFAMEKYLRHRRQALMLIASPKDKPRYKEKYDSPLDQFFDIQFCFDGKYEAAIDRWLQDIP